MQTGKTAAKDVLPFAEGNIGKFLQLTESESFTKMKRDMEDLLDRFLTSEDHGKMQWIQGMEAYEDELEKALDVLQILVRERLRKIYLQKRHAERNLPAGKMENKYYMLSFNLIKAKKQLLSNVNKNMIIWNLFLP